ncbi:MAG: ABC transporter substrate-binding protein [Synergistaceae bacterium]|jgi:peptide/nickel transport system substrate-binding protein|nr:ABC transporter substrate-binding protein [Synergistaceae bacterium]
MKIYSKFFVILPLLFLLSAASPGMCGVVSSSSNLQKDELVIATGVISEIGFDPCKGWGRYGAPLFQSTLITANQELTYDYDLATKFEVSYDGLVWTFKIRDDARFSDGVPVKASDVAFTFNTAKKIVSWFDFSLLKEAKAIDDTTVEFHLNEVSSAFPFLTARVGIVPEHAYGDGYSEKPIGSGPYVMVQWDRKEKVIAMRNEHYYGKKPKFKKLTMLLLGTDAAYAAAKEGLADVAKVSEPLAVNKIDGYRLVTVGTIDKRGIALPYRPSTKEVSEKGYPIGNAVTSDIAIRRAINYGISRERVNQDALNGMGRPVYSNADGFPWANPDVVIKDGDVEKAKAILEESGWVDADRDGIREKSGVKAEFTILYGAGDTTRQMLALAVSEQAKTLGINIVVEGMSWDDALPRAHKDASLIGGGIVDLMEFYNHFTSSYGRDNEWINPIYYGNETVDGYLKKALHATSDKEAYENARKAQWDGTTGMSVLGDAPWVWLVNNQDIYFIRDGLDIDVSTQKMHGHSSYFSILSNIEEWDYPKQ